MWIDTFEAVSRAVPAQSASERSWNRSSDLDRIGSHVHRTRRSLLIVLVVMYGMAANVCFWGMDFRARGPTNLGCKGGGLRERFRSASAWFYPSFSLYSPASHSALSSRSAESWKR